MADVIGGHMPTGTARPEPMDQEPGVRLGTALSLLDDIDRAARRLRPLLHTVERMTGLPPAQANALLAFSEGGRLPEGAAPQDAVAALALKGLVTSGRTSTEGDPDGGDVRLTDAGGVALEQVQGLRIRALGTLMSAFDDRQVEEIRDALRGFAEALESLQPATDPRTQRSC